MVLSGIKCCLLLDGVSTESQGRASVLRVGRDFSPLGHVARMGVGLALGLVRLLLSSWKMCVCNLVTWCAGRWWGFLWAQAVLHLWPACFCVVAGGGGFCVGPPEIQTV